MADAVSGDLELLLEHVSRRDRRRRNDLSDSWVLYAVLAALVCVAAGFGAGLLAAGVLEWSDGLELVRPGPVEPLRVYG